MLFLSKHLSPIVIVFIVLAQLSCKKKAYQPVDPEVDPIQKSCPPAQIPMTVPELNTLSRLNYVVNDSCYYQPVHISLTGNNAPAVVVSKFNGKRLDEDNYQIETMSFKYFDLKASINDFVVEKVWKENRIKDTLYLGVRIRDLRNCKTPECEEIIRKRNEGEPDFVLNENFKVPHNSIIDFEVLPILTSLENHVQQLTYFPTGRHCNGRVIFDEN